MTDRLTKFNEETGEYEYRERAKTQEEFNAQRKAVIQRLGELEDKQGEWISVYDGEPEEATNVLCVENDNFYLAFIEDGAWFDCVAYYRDDTFSQVHPTHWMPLPYAPKMKGECDEQR